MCGMAFWSGGSGSRAVNNKSVPFIQPLQPTVKAFDRDGWVIACSSYTKTLAPDYRIGWMEAGRFRDAVRRLKFSSSIAESRLLAEAVGVLLETGGYDHHLRALRRRYAEQVDTVRGLVRATSRPAPAPPSRSAASCCGWSCRRQSTAWRCSTPHWPSAS